MRQRQSPCWNELHMHACSLLCQNLQPEGRYLVKTTLCLCIIACLSFWISHCFIYSFRWTISKQIGIEYSLFVQGELDWEDKWVDKTGKGTSCSSHPLFLYIPCRHFTEIKSYNMLFWYASFMCSTFQRDPCFSVCQNLRLLRGLNYSQFACNASVILLSQLMDIWGSVLALVIMLLCTSLYTFFIHVFNSFGHIRGSRIADSYSFPLFLNLKFIV